MSEHISERIADFVFEELPAAEMVETRQHLTQCFGCREQVEQFQMTHAMLKSSPDAEPPRPIMFEFDKPRTASWIWRWLGPMAVSATVALAVVNFAPRPQPQIVERLVQQQAPPQPGSVAAQPVDYEKIQIWLASEVSRQTAAQVKEVQRMRGELALLDRYQREMERETIENGSSIQLLAQKTDSRE